MWVILWGGWYYVYFSCQTLFFSVIELFLALQNWNIHSGLLLEALAIMLRFHILELELRNILTSVVNPVFNLFNVVLVGKRRVLFCYCLFWLAFLDVLVYLCCLMNRDICWGIFEVLFVPPAEYLNSVCIFLICWCLVSVWPIVGQYVSPHW